MNKTITFAAIAMFAVIMGMGVFAPAMAVPGNEKSSATTAVCHYDLIVDDEATLDVDESLDSAWIVLYTSSQGATNGHQKHGDQLIGDGTEGTITEADCLAQDPPA